MTDRLMAVIALAVFAAFLGILAWKVPSLDLVLVVVAQLHRWAATPERSSRPAA